MARPRKYLPPYQDREIADRYINDLEVRCGADPGGIAEERRIGQSWRRENAENEVGDAANGSCPVHISLAATEAMATIERRCAQRVGPWEI